MNKNQKINAILLADGFSVLINDFFKVYITLYTMQHLSTHDLAICGMIGALISIIVNYILKNNEVINKLVKNYILIGILITIISSCNIFLVNVNVLVFVIISTFIFTGLFPLQSTVFADFLNSIFMKRELTLFSVRRKWIFAVATFIASVATMLIDDAFVLTDNIHFVFVLYVMCGLSDIFTMWLCHKIK